MKKIIVLLAIAFFAISGIVANESDYVVFDGKVYFCDHAKVTFKKIKLYNEEGLDQVIPLRNVDRYCIEGRVFQRLPLVCKDGDVKCTALLELISYRNGLGLYKYGSMNDQLGTCFEDSSGWHGIYFIFTKNNEYYLTLGEKDIQSVMPFFGINVAMGIAAL